MVVMTNDPFAQALLQEGCSAILRTDDTENARLAMEAAVRGGFRIIEFTLSIPGALELVAEFSGRPGLVVGVGTVLTATHAAKAAQQGAKFLVSPVMDPEVITKARELGLPMIPGCATPTEMFQAYRAGAMYQKLFPEVPNGPAWVRMTLAAMPFLQIVPTSGVTLENGPDYLLAGAYAIGYVNSLFVPAEVKGRNTEAIEARARRMIESVRKLRPGLPPVEA